MKKKNVWHVLKYIIVAVIFIYLYKSGQFELSKLKSAYIRFDMFIAATFLIFCGSLIAVQRWRFLLYIQNISIGFWQAAKLTFIGFFFSAVIPGSVSGDIVKAYYLAKGEDEKEVLVTAVFFDRLVGLYTILLLGTFSIFAGFIYEKISGKREVWSEPYIISLGVFIFTVFLGMTILGMLFMSKNIRRSNRVEKILLKLPFHTRITKIYDAVHEYGKKPLLTLIALMLSIISQIPLYAGMWCLGILLNITALTVIDFFIALPVCFLINAIPLAPGGLGVGEAGFRTIFLLFGSEEGAELSVLFHVIFFFLALGLGSFVYLFSDISRAKVKKNFQ